MKLLLPVLLALFAGMPLAALADEPVQPKQSAWRPSYDKTDKRIIQLAETIVANTGIKKGEHVLIQATCVPDDVPVELIRAVRAVGGIPHVRMLHSRIQAEMVAGETAEQFELEARLLMEETKAMDVCISVYGKPTPPSDRYQSRTNPDMIAQHLAPVSLVQNEEKHWCHLDWPTAAKAKAAGMPQKELWDYYLDCCLMSFEPLRPAMEKLKAMMEATDQVRIVGPGTDLTFSIKGVPVIAGYGEYNLPDGEVFTAPVRESVNGTLRVNLTSVYADYPFEDINLRFENGRIVEVTSTDKATRLVMRKLIDKEEDNHYLGEFALGVNPLMHKPIKDTLFDEKIAGSFHVAIGRCVSFTPNGNNKTLLHWDLVILQRAQDGGGEIYFDGKLIRKDGIFLDPELAPLNPKEMTIDK